MKFSYVRCLLVMSTVLASCRGDDDSLEDAVRTLRGQVSALLERRQEDYKLLEESLKNELEKNSQLSSLRDEVETLRREVSLLRGNQQKNDHLTLQWLSSSVTELRAELTELAVAQNTSAELQRRQETESELHLLRGDSAALRRETEELRADVQKGAARAEQAAGDAEAARERSQAAQLTCADLSQQLQEAQMDWVTLKALRKTRSSAKVPDSEEDNNELSAMLAATPSAPGEERKYRHQRLLQKQVQEVHSSAKKLTSSQARLQHQVHRLEKQVKTLLHSNSAGPDDGAATRELRERVSNLESSSRLSARSLFNMSRQLVALDKLHLSLLQLLESVESLENKVDRGLPDLQREISKMEFGRAQITSTSALLKEEVENQRASVKALSVGVSALQEKTDKDHSRLTEVQEQLSNLSSSLQAVPVAQVVALVSSNDTLTSLVQDLSRVQSEYRDIVSRLPHDCASTGGGRGLSLIAPGPGGPLVAWCAEEGWTVVQRRVDGSQEFNRNWSDYQAGFGSPAGEFWLGNEPLHRLTSDNCSQLRVDLQDIYGKRWRAEYSEFSVSGDHDGYRLHVTGYRGNASDALDYQNRMQFSAIDSDRDISNTHCAANYEGGWWFSHCQHANLNGRYNLGLTWFDAAKNEWIAVAWSEMKVRRREGCEGRT